MCLRQDTFYWTSNLVFLWNLKKNIKQSQNLGQNSEEKSKWSGQNFELQLLHESLISLTWYKKNLRYQIEVFFFNSACKLGPKNGDLKSKENMIANLTYITLFQGAKSQDMLLTSFPNYNVLKQMWCLWYSWITYSIMSVIKH